MQARIIGIIAFCIFFGLGLNAQDDPVLFTVDGTKVHKSEFDYIYSKTNGEKADYSEKSVREYLDLYVKFKLKVQKAKEMKIDTIPALKRELAGYRKQLADSYLIDKEVKDKLLREAYNRMQEDVRVSHIMVSKTRNPEQAWDKINDIHKRLKGGADFGKTAFTESQDQYSKKEYGKIGWINATLPDGFYDMESAAYETPVGQFSEPFETKIGIHILKVDEKRPARGTIEVAHILCMKDPKNKAKNPEALIKEAYTALQAGTSFEEVVAKFSDDKKSVKKGGYIGFFGIGANEPVFEDAAFGLKKDGEYSAPFQSSVGWHIVKRISRPDMGNYETEKRRLQSRIEKDSRFMEARNAMITDIKKESKYMVNEDVFKSFTKDLTKDFNSGKWRAPKPSDDVLFTFGEDKSYTLGQFTDYLLRSARQRIRTGRQTRDPQKTAMVMLEQFSGEAALNLEKEKLSEKYPDFRSLMREYEEGILLFEATKMLVWDKAGQDTVGLRNFYNANPDKYFANEKARVSIYTIKSDSEAIINKARKLAAKKPAAKVLKKVNKSGNLVTVREEVKEKGRNSISGLEDGAWKKGALSETQIGEDGSSTFVKVEGMLPRARKKLEEARGYVIADYQDELEAQWIGSLREEYKVNINETVLKSIFK